MVGIWQLGQALTGQAARRRRRVRVPRARVYRGTSRTAAGCASIAPAHRLVFAARVLDLPLVNADPVAMQLAREQLERELARVVDAGLPSRIRARCSRTRRIALDRRVAKQLRMSPRTLKRKLAEHGTTFSAIRDDSASSARCSCSTIATLSIGEIAAKLGYSELPNFTRAFKWTGDAARVSRARLISDDLCNDWQRTDTCSGPRPRKTAVLRMALGLHRSGVPCALSSPVPSSDGSLARPLPTVLRPSIRRPPRRPRPRACRSPSASTSR